MSIEQIGTAANALGALGLLALALFARYRQWWVDGPSHQRELDGLNAQLTETKSERDEWKRWALAGWDATAKSIAVAEAHTGKPEGG